MNKVIFKDEIISIIPAKGSSRRLPNKNIMDFHGKPLLCWTIEASLNSKNIAQTLVTSEDDNILDIAKKAGSKIIKRPNKLSKSNASSESVIIHTLKYFKKIKNYLPKYFILLQPTSPLRTKDDIDDAFKLFFASKANALVSGYEIKYDPFKSLQIDNIGLLNRPKISGKRYGRYIYQNGAIYIIKTKVFLNKLNLVPQNTIPFFMSIEKSVDIDTKDDLNLAKSIYKKEK